MKHTTERKWHSWLNGVVLTTCPSMWVRQRRLWWTSGETLLTTPHWPSTARQWRESAALNSSWEELTWTTNTMSISKKAQQHLHFLCWLKRASLPPPILTTFYRGTIECVLTRCITVWYGNCKTLQRTVNTAAKIISAPLPSILDIFLVRCSSKANSIVKDRTWRKTVPEHQSPLHQTAQQLFSPGCESPELNAHRPSMKPHTNALPPENWTISPPPPPLTSSQKKTVKLFCAIQSVLHTGEWACTNHL